MLAGAPPFTGDSAVEILTAHIGRSPPDPRRAMPGAPARLRRLAAWMMEKEPARRPRDARAALEALEHGGALRGAGVSRWLRSRRRRFVAGAAGAVGALALASALFLPVGTRIDDEGLSATSPLGVPVRRFAFGNARAVDALPWHAEARWSRLRVALLNRPGNAMPEPFTTALARADLLTGSVEPLAPPGLLDPATRRFPAFFPHFGTDFGGSGRLLALPPSGDAGPRFAASFKQDEYPALLSIFSERQVDLLTPHPGWIWSLALAEPSVPGSRRLLVAAAENHPLGQRLAVFAVPADGPIGAARVGFPPFDLDLSSPREPVFYTFLSRGGEVSLAVEGDRVRVDSADGKSLVLDASTGVPVELADRDGLSPGEWQAQQKELFARLLAAGRVPPEADAARLDAAAGPLEAFAAQPRLGRVQRGVALARAAQLRMRQGRDAAALELIEQAVDLEPQVPGHYRLRIDLLARLGRWMEAADTLAGSPSIVASADPVRFQLVLAGLASGQLDGVRAFLAQSLDRPRFGSDYYDHLASALVDLHAGRGDDAVAHLDRIPRSRVLPNFAFYRAMADVLRGTPDLADARGALAVARQGRGSGHCPPFAALEAYLDALEGRAARDLSAIEAELSVLRRTARELPLDRWFLPWGEAFAARACLAAGDRDGFERHAAAARAVRAAQGEADGVGRVLRGR